MGPSRSCLNDTTSALQPGEITSKRTSLVSVLSIKVPRQKKSGNLFNDPRIYIIFVIYEVPSISFQTFFVYREAEELS